MLSFANNFENNRLANLQSHLILAAIIHTRKGYMNIHQSCYLLTHIMISQSCFMSFQVYIRKMEAYTFKILAWNLWQEEQKYCNSLSLHRQLCHNSNFQILTFPVWFKNPKDSDSDTLCLQIQCNLQPLLTFHIWSKLAW